MSPLIAVTIVIVRSGSAGGDVGAGTGVAVAGMAVAGMAVAGMAVAGMAVAGMAVAGMAVAGMAVAGTAVAGTAVGGTDVAVGAGVAVGSLPLHEAATSPTIIIRPTTPSANRRFSNWNIVKLLATSVMRMTSRNCFQEDGRARSSY